MGSATTAGQGLQDNPVELLQRLIRFDTTNPPGNERACIDWIAGVLREAGVEPKVIGREPDRPNLIARLPGTGKASPLLMQGHVDVVPTEGRWSQAPFGGEISDGFLWGRGALDMKGGVAMMLAAFLRTAEAADPPPADVLLCILSDEERGGDLGARFLVDEHSELFDGVRFAIGEFGGFTVEISGRRFYPIMVAEKQLCVLRATLRGPAGHGSLPVRHGAMGRLGDLLRGLDRKRLPVHVTPIVRSMIESIAAEIPAVAAVPLRALLRPRIADRVLDALGEPAGMFDPLLHNTASATIVRGGRSANVIPGEVSVDLDCRLLPGFGPDDVIEELRGLARTPVEIEVLRYDPGAASSDMSLFPALGAVLGELDASAHPVPLLLPAVTDGRHFARLGIQTYGFLPMPLPADMRFMELVHAPDERIPVDSLEFGTTAIQRLIERLR